MTFDKCTINGRVYGDLVDASGNVVDVTEVCFLIKYLTFLSCRSVRINPIDIIIFLFLPYMNSFFD